MDVVLGVALTVERVQLVLVEGRHGEGRILAHDEFRVDHRGGVESASTTEHVINAVLGTYAVATANGNTVHRIAITWTDAMSMEAGLLLDALDEIELPGVVAVTGYDAVESLAGQIAVATGTPSVAVCLAEGLSAPVCYIAVVHSEGAETLHIRSRALHTADRRQLALSVRGACAELTTDLDQGLAVFAAGSATPITGMLATELNSMMSRPVTIPEDAAYAFARAAALASGGMHRQRCRTVDSVGDVVELRPPAPSIFVPRTAKLLDLPVGMHTSASPAASDSEASKRVRRLTTVVAASVLVLVSSLSMAIGGQLFGDTTTTAQATPPPSANQPEQAPVVQQAAQDTVVPAQPSSATAPPAPEPAAPAPAAASAVAAPTMPAAPAPPNNPLQLLATVAGPQLAAINQGLHGDVPPVGDPALNGAALQVAQAVAPPVIAGAQQPLDVPAVPPLIDQPVTLPPIKDLIDSIRQDRQGEDQHFGDIPPPSTPYYQPPAP
ncbi:hypothetical protein BayCH28_25355 [Mycolicibacterium sp. CH28]|uniref:DUF7159 family protein n=1 Tax=Mycolicibacterium sp. CH28 TaxID=2512237 RepID=UPI0010810C7F|nr:hypothetical protein [Mycolicibacterium sp. CH28]TGD84714.1 hypothetical protein BayCH28_25355 [Mycolicibacterium sp. CH28]